jgi:hypothetical protein
MTFQTSHFGLYFDRSHKAAVLAQRPAAPVADAWYYLMSEPPQMPLAALHFHAYRYRLADDSAAGEQALMALHAPYPEAQTRLEQLRQTIARLHLWEMLRDHPANLASQLPFLPTVEATLADDMEMTPLEAMWHHTLCITAGVVFNDEPLFERGAAGFRQVIDHDIHIEGYIKSAVNGKSEYTFLRQMQMVCALTLAAEAATHAGVNLWQYENRGVGVATAAAYLVYYYFYPEKWRWSDMNTLSLETTRQLFREQGAFMEIVTYRTQPRSVELLLEDQRPMFDPLGGGMTTLTHGKFFAPKKRGWFGRK